MTISSEIMQKAEYLALNILNANEMAYAKKCIATALQEAVTAARAEERVWLPIEHADKTIVDVRRFEQVGITLRNSERFWVRDADGRAYEASWSESDIGSSYWWDWKGESPTDPVEFMPHPLDARWSTPVHSNDPLKPVAHGTGTWQREHEALGELIRLLDLEPSIGDAEMADALEKARCAWDHSRIATLSDKEGK